MTTTLINIIKNRLININMRCIEIKMVGDIDYMILRLTLT